MKKSLTTGVLGSAFAVLGVLLLSSCSGGGGGSQPQPPTVLAFSAGTLTTGSVIVNGVEFTAAPGAAIVIDGNSGTEAGLRNGMQAKVGGAMNSDGATGIFVKVKVGPEVRGKLAARGAVDDFTVNGQHVVVDDLTVFEDRVAGAFNALTFGALVNGDTVEIHGLRDASGIIKATRVERRDDKTAADDEVKGTVAAPITATSFALVNGITTVTVNFTGATVLTPAGKTVADISAGAFVQVHGPFSAGPPSAVTATTIDFEDAVNAEFEPAEGQQFQVEGLISGFTANPGTFKTGNSSVQTTALTTFEGGVAADLADGMRVEVEGHKTNGILAVEKLKFRDNVRIEANVEALAAGTSLTVLGKNVKISTTTQTSGAPVVGGGVKIKGFASGATLTATRINAVAPIGANNIVLQGPISAVTATSSITIAGIAVSTSGITAANGFQDSNGIAMTAADFFAALRTTSPVTIVKATGTFNGTTLTAKEVELESPH